MTAERSDSRTPHPYDLAFGQGAIDDRLFPPIAEEAEARGMPLDEPDRFLFLSSVGQLIRAVAGPEPYAEQGGLAPSEPHAGAAEPSGPSEPIRQYGRLLFHAFHYWRAGRRTERLDREVIRRLLDGDVAADDWTLRTPASSGYLRLPRNLVWGAAAAGLQPEPVDGFFWTFVADAAPPALHVLLVLGVREDRPGFSIAPATGLLDDEPHWVDLDARPGGTDFETTLPGGEIDRLYSVQTPAEILKLASLCFLHLDRDADAARG